ncbi:hypothetical protein IWW47_002838, partial [Coemansia sp. RSA 2052]
MTVSTTTAADASQGHGKSSSTTIEQRVAALGVRLRQAAAAETVADRAKLLAKAAELCALASEFEQVAGSLDALPSPTTASSFVGSGGHGSFTVPLRSTRQTSSVVKMPPRLSTMFAEVSVSALEEDSGSEFNAQVAVPPGGLTFIASAAVMQESDDEEEEERDEERAGTGGNGGPAYAEDPVAADARVETATAEGVGGFAHPTETFAQAILAQASASAAATAAMRAREGADSAVQMPVPADHVATAGEQQPPPSGFDVY